MPKRSLFRERRGALTVKGLLVIIFLATAIYAGGKFTGPVVRYMRTKYVVEEHVLKARVWTDQRIRRELLWELKEIGIPNVGEKNIKLNWTEKKFTVKVKWVEKITFPGGLEFVWPIVMSDTKEITKSNM